MAAARLEGPPLEEEAAERPAVGAPVVSQEAPLGASRGAPRAASPVARLAASRVAQAVALLEATAAEQRAVALEVTPVEQRAVGRQRVVVPQAVRWQAGARPAVR